jgi:hypothetical protein
LLERLTSLISGGSEKGAYPVHVFAKYFSTLQCDYHFQSHRSSIRQLRYVFTTDSTRTTSAVTQSTTPPGSPPRRAQPAASTEAVADVQNALLALLSQAASNPSQAAQT